MRKQKIPFLSKVKDKITGLAGTVTCYCVYFTGCIQYEVKFLSKDKDDIKSIWFDEERLEVLSSPEKDKPASTPRNRAPHNPPTGGPSRGPTSRS